MIKVTYRFHGGRPRKTDIVREDANKAAVLPPSFEIQAVAYQGERITLVVDPPSDSISSDAVDAIAAAFEDNWGGTVEHLETETQ